MSRAHQIKALLPDPTIEVNESTLSFVKYLLPEFKSTKTLLLHREKKLSAKHVQLEATQSNDMESSFLDTTGSPLQYELDYPEVDETFIDDRNWKKEEEFYSPLTKLEARLAMNCCLEKFSNQHWSLPLLAICNGKDNDKTILLGSYFENGWFTSIQGRCMDPQLLSNIEKTPALLLEEYINMNSLQKHQVVTTICSTYELYGRRPGITDSSDLLSDCFSGNLSIEMNWNTVSFYAPIRDSTSTVIMEIIPGSDESYLKKLWEELTLLNQYLNMLEQSETNKQNSFTIFPSNSVSWVHTKEKLDELLNGENEEDSHEDDNDEDCADVTDDCKLTKHVDNTQFRQTMDFPDMLWELLIGCADNTQVTNCFRILLERVQSGQATPQVAPANSSRIAKIISDILCQKQAIPLLTENSPLELLVDTGLEKLSRDYTYILLHSNFVDIHDISQMLCNIKGEGFNTENYRKKLTSLAQIHLCLEFTLFAENCKELQFSTANLRSIFINACQEYASKNSPVKSFSDLHDNQIRCLNVSLPTIALEHIAKALPSSWCLTISSKSNTLAITTTSHLSRNPILPPNIYSSDELTKHEVYHILNVDTASIKIA